MTHNELVKASFTMLGIEKSVTLPKDFEIKQPRVIIMSISLQDMKKTCAEYESKIAIIEAESANRLRMLQNHLENLAQARIEIYDIKIELSKAREELCQMWLQD